MSKNVIEPKKALFIDIHNYLNIPFIVVDTFGNICTMCHVNKTGSNYKIRQKSMETITQLVEEQTVDTIVMEQNRLFIDKIDRHPDPVLLHNILLGFGIKTSIEDKYYDTLNLLELPEQEWRDKVLNKSVKYSIDLYKSHVLQHNINLKNEDMFKVIDENNYYKAICFSESVWFDTLMNKKYQINK